MRRYGRKSSQTSPCDHLSQAIHFSEIPTSTLTISCRRLKAVFYFVTRFSSWGKRAAHNRAQIVYYMAENLELRHDEFSKRLCDMTGCSLEEAKKEVDTTIQRLFYWGAYADKYGGTVQVSLNNNLLGLLES